VRILSCSSSDKGEDGDDNDGDSGDGDDDGGSDDNNGGNNGVMEGHIVLKIICRGWIKHQANITVWDIAIAINHNLRNL